jgi:gliding motility-associated-like protein
LACYETAAFNTTTCAWVVLGTQPIKPTLACYETAAFNTTTCAWVVSGTQPVQPTTAIECWETRSFETTSCQWKVTGIKPIEPTTTLECWETRAFDTATCSWLTTGAQKPKPTGLVCSQIVTFNTTTCDWEITALPIEVSNAVTPNGDGDNDYFHIGGLDCYSNNTVEIYNRWGVLVFEASKYNNVDNVFNGSSNGRSIIKQSDGLADGTYYYVIKYVDFSGKVSQKAGYLYLSK